MKNILTSIIAVAALSFAVTTASAAKPGKGEKKKGDPAAMFAKIDSNSDGSISLDEWKAGPAGKKDAVKAEEVFKKKDKDSDGKLTKEEAAGGAGGEKKKKKE